jgi:hypothetical protein
MSYGDPYAEKAAAAAGTEDLPWVNADISTWTLNNPSGTGTPNATQDGAGNITFTWAGLTNSIQDNVITAGSVINSPRIYIPLVRPDGTPYRFDDAEQNITIRMKIFDFDRPADVVADTNSRMNAVIGLAAEPTQTSTNDLKFAGLGAGYTGTNANRSFICYAGAANTLTNLNHRSAIGTLTYAGNGGGAVDVLTFTDAGSNQVRSSRNTNLVPLGTRTGPIYLMLAWGPSGTGIDLTGESIKMKIAYQVVSFDKIT